MDEIDLAILTILQKDARTPLSEISNNISLSLPAVSERLRKLEKIGFIKNYTAILNPEKFGKTLCCFCFIALRNEEANDQNLHDFIKEEPDIIECHFISGEYEYVLKIMVKSTKDLETLLIRIRGKNFVIRTNTYIVLSTLKESPSIAPTLVDKKGMKP